MKELLWPDADRIGREIIPAELPFLYEAIAQCERRRIAVQAGGNVGLFPLRMIETGFETVLTFEPVRENFECLIRNTQGVKGLLAIFGAVGDERTLIDMDVWPQNCGSGKVKPGTSAPQFVIDDFHLPSCDLIQLDVEGYEFNALMGAKETIIRCSPVIMIEDRGHGQMLQGALPAWIETNFGYTAVAWSGTDVILTKD